MKMVLERQGEPRFPQPPLLYGRIGYGGIGYGGIGYGGIGDGDISDGGASEARLNNMSFNNHILKIIKEARFARLIT